MSFPDPLLTEACSDTKKVEKAISDLTQVLHRLADANSAKAVKECDSSNLKSEKDLFVHRDEARESLFGMEVKEKKKKKSEKADAAEIMNEWEDNERSIDTIFLPRSRGPLGRSRDIDLKRVNITINGNELLAGATLRLHAGRHYGLVGRNGVGKSTLLRRMALARIDGFPDYLMVLHVKQEIDGTDTSVIDTVIQSDKERLALLQVGAGGVCEARSTQTWRRRWRRWTAMMARPRRRRRSASTSSYRDCRRSTTV